LSAAVYSIVSDISQKAASIQKAYEVIDDKKFQELKRLKGLANSPENDFKISNCTEKLYKKCRKGTNYRH